jgi:hypothetical protein
VVRSSDWCGSVDRDERFVSLGTKIIIKYR